MSELTTAAALRDQAFDRLRDAILAGELRAGERLSVAALAEAYGVSTMPVREALRRLESEGLVQTSARRWTRVATPDRRVAREAYPVILALEELVLEQGEHDLTVLRFHNTELQRAVRWGDAPACLRADEAFHTALAAGAGNRTLADTLAMLRGRVRLLEGAFFRLAARERSPGEHEAIVAGLERGDLEAARAALRANWERGQRAVLTTLEAGG